MIPRGRDGSPDRGDGSGTARNHWSRDTCEKEGRPAG